DERRGGRALGLLQPARSGRRAAGRRARDRVRPRARPDVRARDDEADAQRGMGDEPRRRNRSRGRGASDLHADRGLRARVPRVRRRAAARLRGELMAARTYLEWPFFEDRHRALKDELDAFPAGLGELAHDESDPDATCRALVRRLADSGLLRLTAELDV